MIPQAAIFHGTERKIAQQLIEMDAINILMSQDVNDDHKRRKARFNHIRVIERKHRVVTFLLTYPRFAPCTSPMFPHSKYYQQERETPSVNFSTKLNTFSVTAPFVEHKWREQEGCSPTTNLQPKNIQSKPISFSLHTLCWRISWH